MKIPDQASRRKRKTKTAAAETTTTERSTTATPTTAEAAATTAKPNSKGTTAEGNTDPARNKRRSATVPGEHEGKAYYSKDKIKGKSSLLETQS